MPAREELANALRALSMDAVEQAKSGHPGMPMGMATIAEVLWNDFLLHNPADPHWVNRDRFILSNGHGVMLQYALLHLTGYDLSIEDIKQFRQLHSKTPGHPEFGQTPGVETTTGPLGQGLANGVGMALAERSLGRTFNRPGLPLIDHYTYVFAGDGCLMEGISHEACSLAGVMGLAKLIVFWDDNGISIDGDVRGWFSDDTPARFAAYGWHVIANVDGHDADAVHQAIVKAKSEHDKPTLICCRTTIGYGAPNMAGTAKTHGAPLGHSEVALARDRLGWPYPPFVIPQAVYAAWDARTQGEQRQGQWQELADAYAKAHPACFAELQRRLKGELPASWAEHSAQFVTEQQNSATDMATRKASLATLNAMAPILPELLGGSADLTGSNLTRFNGAKTLTHSEPDGNYIYFGVREFAMSAMMTGVALHGGFIPFSGTFLTFLDYARNAVRMAALMQQRVIFIYTHDSIGLGEDGPTHQPIEHLAMLRLTPNISLWRPCDAVETAVAWHAAIARSDGPTCLALSRQTLAKQARTPEQVANISKGGYILADSQGTPQVILIATGSEVALAMQARAVLQAQGQRVRVVSLPSTDVFMCQAQAYREQVLPSAITARIVIEAGATDIWRTFATSAGVILGIDRFGESAPYQDIYRAFGLTSEAIVEAAQSLIGQAIEKAHE